MANRFKDLGTSNRFADLETGGNRFADIGVAISPDEPVLDPAQVFTGVPDIPLTDIIAGPDPTSIGPTPGLISEPINPLQAAVGTTSAILEGTKTFGQAFVQSSASKPALALKGATVFTPGEAFGFDKVLNKVSEFLNSLRNPNTKKEIEQKTQGKLFPIQEGASWADIDTSLLPEVINTWAANVGDQIPLMLMALAGKVVGKSVGKQIGSVVGFLAGLITGGPDPTDVATIPAIATTTAKIVEHLGGAAPLIAIEAGGFMEQAESLKIDKDIAEKYARIYGIGSGAVEYAQVLWNLKAFKRLTGPARKTILKRVLTEIGGSAFEGLEEFTQQGMENFFLSKAIDEMKQRNPAFEAQRPKIFEGGGRAFTIGTGVSIITRGFGRSSVVIRDTLSPQAQTEVDAAVDDVIAINEPFAGVLEEAQRAGDTGAVTPTPTPPVAAPVAERVAKPPVVPPKPSIAEQRRALVERKLRAGEEVAPDVRAEFADLVAEIEAPTAKPVTVETKQAQPKIVQGETVTKQTETDVEDALETDVTDPAFPTSTKHASTKEIRERLGIGQVNSKTRRSDEEAMAQAVERKIPEKASRLADEINTEPRALSDIEDAGMRIKVAELEIEHEQLSNLIGKATDDADIKTLGAEITRVRTEFDAIQSALETSGTEAGRALRARRVQISRDFKLISVLNQAKAAAGKKISAAKEKIFKKLTSDLAETNKRVDTLESEVAELKARGTLQRGARRFTTMNKQQRQTSRTGLATKLNELLQQGCAN